MLSPERTAEGRGYGSSRSPLRWEDYFNLCLNPVTAVNSTTNVAAGRRKGHALLLDEDTQPRLARMTQQGLHKADRLLTLLA
jgi:hypothetical protein